MRLPLGGGMVFRTSGTWPRTKALYCYPVSADEWPADPDIVERVGLRSCVRRGAAIDLILDRGRENRSQLVFTNARGRDAVFWQSPAQRLRGRFRVAPVAGHHAVPARDDLARLARRQLAVLVVEDLHLAAGAREPAGFQVPFFTMGSRRQAGNRHWTVLSPWP